MSVNSAIFSAIFIEFARISQNAKDLLSMTIFENFFEPFF